MNEGLLEISLRIYGFDRLLYSSRPSWAGCVFEQGDDHVVHLCFQEFGIDSATAYDAATARIDQQMRRLVLAWQYQFGHHLRPERRITHEPSFLAARGIASTRSSAAISAHAVAHVYPAPPPPEMPQAPLHAERWIKTFAEAGEFRNFPDEQLRRFYLIIEELWRELASELTAEERDEIGRLKLIRDFVSHDKCNKQAIIDFVRMHLPDAETLVSGERVVRFLRTTEHRNFIGRHESVARRIARRLIDLKNQRLGLQQEGTNAP